MLNISFRTAVVAILIALLSTSLMFNVWMAYQLSLVVKAYESQELNAKTLEFTRMFVEDILMANTEISFDTRLTLETTVRNLGDQQILEQWQKFTKATTKEEASNQAKNLLNLLVKKISL